MKSDLVSIIIPVYNAEKFLRESIESTLTQTYDSIEVIAIDDGSTDHSLEILQKYSDKITTVSQQNSGLASALNVGISKARGKWIKWFSPDDILYPDAIEVLVEQAKQLSEKTIIYSNWDIIDEQGKILRSFYESNYNNLSKFDFNVRLLSGQQINVNTTLIPISLIKDGCIFKNISNQIAIDYDFFLRAGILFHTRFFLIKKSLIKYRIHSNQLSHKNISKTINFLEQIQNDILNKLSVSKKEHYNLALKKYVSQTSFKTRSMKIGLKLGTYVLPKSITDRILVFYLNKIRSKRL